MDIFLDLGFGASLLKFNTLIFKFFEINNFFFFKILLKLAFFDLFLKYSK